jgi:hypothetical protein
LKVRTVQQMCVKMATKSFRRRVRGTIPNVSRTTVT